MSDKPPLLWTVSATSLDTQEQCEVQELIELDVPNGASLGLMISGGVDDPYYGPEDTGLYVTEIMPGSAAAEDGRVQPEDRILSVNGNEVQASAQHEECVNLVRSAVASQRVSLLVQRVLPVNRVPWRAFFGSRHGHATLGGGYVSGTVPHLMEGLLPPVTLHRPSSSADYGLALTGTPDAGVFIAAVMAGSAAADATSLSQGLQLMEVNGWNVQHASPADVHNIMANSDVLHVLARSNPEGFLPFAAESFAEFYKPLVPPNVSPKDLGSKRKVVLRNVLEAGGRLGLGIGGPPSDGGMTVQGIFVTQVDPNGLAGQDSRLRVGDQILEINGLSLHNASHETAARALKSAGNVVNLLVVFNPMGHSYFIRETERDALHNPESAATSSPHGLHLDMPPLKLRAAPEDGAETRTVTLKHDVACPFGLELAVTEAGVQVPSVTIVSGRVLGSPAAACSDLAVGQQLYAVDGVSIDTLGLEGAREHIAAVHTDGCNVQLTVSAAPVIAAEAILLPRLVSFPGTQTTPKDLKLVELDTAANGLGFRVAGALDATGVQPSGVYVVSVDPRTSSVLRVGQRVVEVSTAVHGRFRSLLFASEQEANAALLQAKISPGKTLVVVADAPAGLSFLSAARAFPNGGASVYESAVALVHGEANGSALFDGTASAATGSKDTSALDAMVELPRTRGHSPSAAPVSVPGLPGRRQSRIISSPPFLVQTQFTWRSEHRVEGELSFRPQEVFEITSLGDGAWWHARRVVDNVAGKIPSRSAYELYYKGTPEWLAQQAHADNIEASMKHKEKTLIKEMRNEALTIHSYIVVERRGCGHMPRPVAVMGAFADRLVVPAVQSLSSVTAAQPLRCTSRPMRDGEKNGREYEFVSREEMEKRLAERELVEVGEFKGNLYGTTIGAVRRPMEEGKLVVLHCHPTTIRRLRLLGDIHPLVIFVKPASLDNVENVAREVQASDALQQYEQAADLELQHAPLFTHVVSLSNDLTKPRVAIADIIRREAKADFWAALPFIAPRTEDLADKVGGMAPRATVTAGCIFRTILLSKNRSGSFGFRLVAGGDSHQPPRVHLLSPGPAHITDEHLQDGDLVLCINNTNVVLESLSKANDLIKRSGDELSIVVFPVLCRPRGYKLKRKAAGFGLTIQSQEEGSGVVVANSKHATIAVGETVLAVNGASMQLATQSEVMSIFAHSKSITIVVGPAPLPNATRVVLGPAKDDIGIKLATAKDGAHPYITDIRPGSVAAKSQQARPGDMLVQVNDLSTAVLEMREIQRLLNAGQGVTLSLVPAPEDIREAVAHLSDAGPLRLVNLHLGPDGLGLRIAAADNPTPLSLPVVKEVLPQSAAAQSGAIFAGDVILKINGHGMQGVAHMGVLQILREQRDVELVLRTGPPHATAKEAAAVGAAAASRGSSDSAARNQPAKPATAKVTLHNRRRLTLVRGSTGLGMRVGTAEGIEYPRVLSVIEGGAAEQTGSVFVDDLIIAINNQNMSRHSHEEVLSALTSTESVILDLAQSSLPEPTASGRTSFATQPLEEERHVTLVRGATGYGMQIQTLNEPDPQSYPLVGRVVQGSVADKEANLFEGDSILSVNGTSMAGVTQETVTSALSATTQADLVVRRLRPSEVVDTWRAVLERNGGPLGLEIQVDQEQESLPRILRVVSGSVAEREGSIGANDEIRYVNGTSAHGLSHKQLVQLLTATDPVTLGLRRVGTGAAPVAPTATSAPPAQAAAAPSGEHDAIPGGGEKRVVIIKRGTGGLGMHIMTEDNPTEHSYPAVSDLVPGGAVDKSGAIFQGDAILSINGQSTRGFRHEAVLNVLRQAGTDVTLEVQQVDAMASLARRVSELRRESADTATAEGVKDGSLMRYTVPLTEEEGANQRRVVVPRQPGMPLGLQIVTADEHHYPIVQKVLPNGTAVATGDISPGDVIYSINGTSVYDKGHEEVIDLLKASPTEVVLVLGRALEPDTPLAVTNSAATDADRTAAAAATDAAAAGAATRGTREVVVTRAANGFGMRLTTVPAGVFVTRVVEGGAADKAGLLRGDALLRIDGQPTAGMDADDAITALRNREDVRLTVGSMPLEAARALALSETSEEQQAQAQDLRLVELRRGARGLGMSITSHDGDSNPMVGEVLPGGPAAASGAILPGDAILAINGQPTVNTPHDALLAMLSSSSEVALLLGRPVLPEGYRLVELEPGEMGLGLRLTIEDEPRPEALPQVAEILPTGAAARSGLLEEGDLLVRVNGRSMAGLRENDVVAALGGSAFLQLVVRQPILLPTGEGLGDVRTVILQRNGGRLGLRVATAEDLSYSQVLEVIPGCVAHAEGSIQRGDVILSVNGRAMAGVSHDDLLAALTSADHLEIVVSSGVPLPGHPEAVSEHEREHAAAAAAAMAAVDTAVADGVAEAAAEPLTVRRASEVVDGPPPTIPALGAATTAANVVEELNEAEESAADGDMASTTATTTAAARPSQVGEMLASGVEEDEEMRARAARPSQATVPVDDDASGSKRAPRASQAVIPVEAGTARRSAGRASQAVIPVTGAEEEEADESSGNKRAGRPSQAAIAVSEEMPQLLPAATTRTVVLHKSSGSSGRLGMRLMTPEAGPSFVAQILPGGAAAASGEVGDGDIIEAVDGTDVRSMPHDALLALLGATSDRVELELRGHTTKAADAMEPYTAPTLAVMEEGAEEDNQGQGEANADATAAAETETKTDPDSAKATGPTAQQVADMHKHEPRSLKRVQATLVRDSGSLGLRIITLGNGMGVLVTEVIPDTPAGRCNKIKANDVIFKINGEDVSSATHEETVQKLTASGNTVELELMPAWAERVAVMDPRQGRLGLRIATGDDGFTYIIELVEGGQGAACGIFNVGDRLVSVNHEDTVGMCHEDVVQALTKNHHHEMVVGVEDGDVDMDTATA